MSTARVDGASRHIGHLAARLGLNPRTIRYYEALGLMPRAARTARGYRLYDGSDEARLRFILKAKAIGLTLAEVRDIVAVQAGGAPPCAYVLTLLDRKVAEIDRKLAALAEMRAELVTLRAEAADTMTTHAEVCGIIESHDPRALKRGGESR